MASSALIDDLLKQFAENPRRVFARLANEYRKRGELDTAIEICRAHVPLQPTYISGYIVLGQALYETGQLDEARSTFETALGLDPENLIGLRQLGDIARAKGDSDGARGWYRRLLEVDPQNEEVEAVLRELDSPAGSAPAESAVGATPPAEQAPVSWNDINPENTKAPEPATAPSTSAVPATEPAAEPAKKALDFDYDVLSSFGEAEALPSFEQPEPAETPHADTSEIEVTIPETPAPAAASAPAAPSRPVVEEPSSHDEPLPAAFITETMAELYLQQGHREQALDIYRLLLAQRPGDVSLLNRIARLEQPAPAAPVERTVRAFFGRFANRRPPGVHTETDIPVVAMPAEPEPAAAEESPPLGEAVEAVEVEAPAQASEPEAHAPSETEPAAPGRDEPSIADFAPAQASAESSAEASAESSAPEPVGAPEPATVAAPHVPEPLHEREAVSDRILSFAELFAGRATSAADEQAATTLAGAFGGDAGVPNGAGHPTRAADDALSLDDVFGGGAHERESAPVTFDEFFASRDAGAHPAVAPEGVAESHPTPAPSSRRADDADLELFHQWLEGLKK